MSTPSSPPTTSWRRARSTCCAPPDARCPTDVAVAGFDDAPIATRTSPELTTMRQPFDRIAREMVRMLLEVIDGQPAARLTMPTELVVRGSA